jgi:hypothetical protein
MLPDSANFRVVASYDLNNPVRLKKMIRLLMVLLKVVSYFRGKIWNWKGDLELEGSKGGRVFRRAGRFSVGRSLVSFRVSTPIPAVPPERARGVEGRGRGGARSRENPGAGRHGAGRSGRRLRGDFQERRHLT